MTIQSLEWLCLSRLVFMTCLSALLPKRLLLTTLVKETVITGTTRSTAYWLYFNASTTDNINTDGHVLSNKACHECLPRKMRITLY